MKLAEALILRADLQKRLEQLRERLGLAVLVQEGETPAEDPEALIAEAERIAGDLEVLIPRINRTNLAVRSGEATLTEALARRDMLALRHDLLNGAARQASGRTRRYGLSEIREVATIDVGKVRREIDRLAVERRELDTQVQATNWAADLVD